MSIDDDEDPFYSGDSSFDDGQSKESEEEEEEEEEEDAEESRSQVTFDTDMTGANFLTPGGLNAFTVALPAKSEKLFLKDLPKPIKAFGHLQEELQDDHPATEFEHPVVAQNGDYRE
jgi:hypothetical protein